MSESNLEVKEHKVIEVEGFRIVDAASPTYTIHDDLIWVGLGNAGPKASNVKSGSTPEGNQMKSKFHVIPALVACGWMLFVGALNGYLNGWVFESGLPSQILGWGLLSLAGFPVAYLFASKSTQST